MVKGLNTFRDFFKDFEQHYIIIGGSACDLHFETLGIPFRATHDLDIVLCIEALDSAFVKKFWEFVRAAQYIIRQKSNGKKEFYRFLKPQAAEYPAMLELFARRPNILPPAIDTNLTPIPTEDEVSSLSAILLNEDYYRYILSQRTMVDRVPIVSAAGLIILKAKAWLDLKARKNEGYPIDSKNIKKHRNDIIDLLPNVISSPQKIPTSIQADMIEFYEQFRHEDIDLKLRKIPSGITMTDILQILSSIFGLHK